MVGIILLVVVVSVALLSSSLLLDVVATAKQMSLAVLRVDGIALLIVFSISAADGKIRTLDVLQPHWFFTFNSLHPVDIESRRGCGEGGGEGEGGIA